MLKKVFEEEVKFNEFFNNTIKEIESKDVTIEDVLEYGFCSVRFEGLVGLSKEDFLPEELKIHVKFDFWGYDQNGYRYIALKRV